MKRDVLRVMFHAPDHFTVAHWGGVALVNWVAKADGTAMGRVHTELRRFVGENPGGVSFIHVTHDGVGLPDAGGRQELAEMMTEFAEVTVCVGVLLVGNGFWASAMQSMLTGMRLLAPPRRWQMRFAARETEIAEWVANAHTQRTQRATAPDELAAMLQQLLAIR
jgi:hypothetical protein